MPRSGARTLLFNATFGDLRTSFEDYQIAWGLKPVEETVADRLQMRTIAAAGDSGVAELRR